MIRHACVVVFCLAPLVGPAPGQESKTPAAPAKPEQGKKTAVQVYSLDQSRRLFLACDLNADDRISYFEASETIDGFKEAERTKFRKVDANSDGFIDFDEYDREFQGRVRYGTALTLTPLASDRLANAPKDAAALDAGLLRFFGSLDKNRDERIDAEEFAAVGTLLGGDARTEMIRLDSDQSGFLSANELQGLLELIKRHEPAQVAVSRSPRQLPEQFRDADLNQNSMLDEDEVARALSRIHPSLARHARKVLEQADANGNGQIEGFEIRDREPRH